MKGLRNLLFEEQIRLEKIIKETKARLDNAPDGRLRLSISHNHMQYYCCKEGKMSGNYISKENKALAQQLAQKSYDIKILHLAEKRYLQIKKILKDYADDELEKVYLKEHLERQKLIEPVEPTWEQRIIEWKRREYYGKDFQEGSPVILTERGERVRSKTEKIMADFFDRHGIEYKYECPLYLKGMGTIYPDFTFLSSKTGKELYWEHCGMVDSPTYARSMIRKIEAYENNGIFSGERLILTYETEQSVLNTEKIAQMVERYL